MRAKRPRFPVALTIAGSDSGGGAGVQADLKTFAAMGVHGASAIACLTAQNPGRVSGIAACQPGFLRKQIEAVFEALPPVAAKTGMLFSAENINVVAGVFEKQRCQLVVDPVMVSTSGARLLKPAAVKSLTKRLLPLATLITPNLDEVAVLLGRKPGSVGEMRAAGREIYRRFGCAVLVKGGHLTSGAKATDIFFDGNREIELTVPKISGVSTHGTGCTYSAAVCAALAMGHELSVAVQMGKRFITAAIKNSYCVGRHFALGQIPASKIG